MTLEPQPATSPPEPDRRPATSEAAEIAWPDTTALPAEDAILADCQTLVDLGHSTWTEPHDEGDIA